LPKNIKYVVDSCDFCCLHGHWYISGLVIQVCEHPNVELEKSLKETPKEGVPDWCPLRKEELILKLKEGV
jgi:hypothetical protein